MTIFITTFYWRQLVIDFASLLSGHCNKTLCGNRNFERRSIILRGSKRTWWYHTSVHALILMTSKASSGSRHHQPFNLLNSCDRERLSSCQLTETQASDRTRIQQNLALFCCKKRPKAFSHSIFQKKLQKANKGNYKGRSVGMKYQTEINGRTSTAILILRRLALKSCWVIFSACSHHS